MMPHMSGIFWVRGMGVNIYWTLGHSFYFILIKFQCNPLGLSLQLSQFYRWENGGSEMFINLPKVVHPLNDVGIWLVPKLVFHPLLCSSFLWAVLQSWTWVTEVDLLSTHLPSLTISVETCSYIGFHTALPSPLGNVEWYFEAVELHLWHQNHLGFQTLPQGILINWFGSEQGINVLKCASCI